MGGGNSYSGGGMRGSGGGNQEEIRAHISALEESIGKLDQELNRTPTKREIQKNMNQMVKDGLLSSETRDTYNTLFDRPATSAFGEEFEQYARGYRYTVGDGSVSLNTVANLHDFSVGTSAMSTSQRQKIVRDFGAFITSTGQYDQVSRNVRDELAKELKNEKARLK